jgi:hypothetical protein
MSDPLSIVVSIAASVVTGAVIAGGVLARLSRVEADVRKLETKHEALDALEDQRHAEQAKERHEDTLARGELGVSLSKVAGLLEGRGGSIP